MLYFAYGSNMDCGQMRQRCPSAQLMAVAKLAEHALQFTRRSKDRDCGVADVVREQGKSVWGVVYDIAQIDVDRLDKAEGFRPGRPLRANSYVRKKRRVYRDGNYDKPILVWIYLGNRQKNPPRPNAEYKKLLIAGAKFWKLPQAYQSELERIETLESGYAL